VTPRPTRSLADELEQNRPFDDPAEELMVALLRTGALVRRALAQIVEPHGISPAQYNVLRILRGAGEEGLPTLTVRRRLIEEAPGITRLIDKLELAGLVRRDRTGADRRTVRCVITDAGRALLDALDPALRALRDRVVPPGTGSANEARRLLEALARLRAALD